MERKLIAGPKLVSITNRVEVGDVLKDTFLILLFITVLPVC